ncbi:MAG: hypothetical protein M3313_07635, partial [Actinomycetota bacterium]|nr:hypothetical protein [Actinomycetota bacterium]
MTRSVFHSPVRSSRRREWRAGLLVGLVLLLSGCLKYDLTLVVSEDDTLDGTMIVAIAREFAVGEEALGRTGDITTSQGSVIKEPYEDADYVGSRFVLSGVPISEIDALATDGSSQFSLTRDGDQFVLDANLDFNLAGSESVPTGSSFTAMVSFSFPGAVLESNGEINGNTVAWTELSPDTANSLTARASAVPNGQATSSPGSATPWWLWALVGVGVLLVLSIIAAFLRRSGRVARAAAQAGPQGWPGQQPGAYNEYGVWVPATVDGQQSGYHDSGQEGGYGSYYGTYGDTPSGAYDYPQAGSYGDPYGGAGADTYGGPAGTEQPGYHHTGDPQAS